MELNYELHKKLEKQLFGRGVKEAEHRWYTFVASMLDSNELNDRWATLEFRLAFSMAQDISEKLSRLCRGDKFTHPHAGFSSQENAISNIFSRVTSEAKACQLLIEAAEITLQEDREDAEADDEQLSEEYVDDCKRLIEDLKLLLILAEMTEAVQAVERTFLEKVI